MSSDDELLTLATNGQAEAQVRLFNLYEPRLRRMLTLRLDHRLQGRLDASDVLQESYIEFARTIEGYKSLDNLPFYLWLRMITLRKMATLQRKFLSTDARDINREISLHRGPMPAASTCSLAAVFVGRLTSPSQAAIRTELQMRVQDALNDLEPVDREVLTLRHFEQLSNAEVAEVLQITAGAASNRYVRALKRLRPVLDEIVAAENSSG
jgi:RNA polymerase sigma-70 factor, ECF subfamily